MDSRSEAGMTGGDACTDGRTAAQLARKRTQERGAGGSKRGSGHEHGRTKLRLVDSGSEAGMTREGVRNDVVGMLARNAEPQPNWRVSE